MYIYIYIYPDIIKYTLLKSTYERGTAFFSPISLVGPRIQALAIATQPVQRLRTKNYTGNWYSVVPATEQAGFGASKSAH